MNAMPDPAKARELALEARRRRAAIKRQVHGGWVLVEDVLAAGARGSGDEVGEHARIAGRIEVGDLLLAVRGIGPVEAAKLLAEAGIDDDETRLDQLSADERTKLAGAVDAWRELGR